MRKPEDYLVDRNNYVSACLLSEPAPNEAMFQQGNFRLMHAILGLGTRVSGLSNIFLEPQRNYGHLLDELGDCLRHLAFLVDEFTVIKGGEPSNVLMADLVVSAEKAVKTGVKGGLPTASDVEYCYLGISRHAGILMDILKHSLFYGEELNKPRVSLNVSYMFIWIGQMLEAIKSETMGEYSEGFDDLFRRNVVKLDRHYPDSFKAYRKVGEDGEAVTQAPGRSLEFSTVFAGSDYLACRKDGE